MAAAKTKPLDPKVADKLLDLLSNDTEYRRLFKKDPVSALEKIGHRDPSLSATSAGAGCYSPQYIAPKREIAGARDQLKAYLTSTLAPTNPHCFEAGKVATALKRVRK